VEKCRHDHDGAINPAAEQKLNQDRFVHLTPTEVRVRMVELGIPVEQMPTATALSSRRFKVRHEEDAPSFSTEFVGSMAQFLLNPPDPVTIMTGVGCETVRAALVTHIFFFEQSLLKWAVGFIEETGVAHCVMDGTYNTNHEKLILHALGICVLHIGRYSTLFRSSRVLLSCQ
jgi:hypothetical protein